MNTDFKKQIRVNSCIQSWSTIGWQRFKNHSRYVTIFRVLNLTSPSTPIVVLTGGPGGGKTSALAIVREMCAKEYSADILTLDETSSMLKAKLGVSGLRTQTQLYAFHKQVFATQNEREMRVQQLADIASAAAVLLDRCVIDCGGFLSAASFRRLLSNADFTIGNLHRRYSMVIFCASAAFDFPAVAARFQKPTSLAFQHHVRTVEHRLMELWQGHPNFVYQPATINIDEKCRQIGQLVAKHVVARQT